MDVVLMVASLPLMMFGGFALDAFSHHDDDKDDDDDDRHDAQPAESGHPPII